MVCLTFPKIMFKQYALNSKFFEKYKDDLLRQVALLCHENIFFPANGPPTNTNFNREYTAVIIMTTTTSNNAVDCCKTVFLS